MSYRAERINSEMQRALMEIIRNKIKDPRVTEMVSVLKTDVAKDLKTAKVIVSIYGDEDKCKTTFEALKNCAGFMRKALSEEFRELRVVPQLNFILDNSMQYSEKINTLIEGIKKHDDN